MHHRRTLRSRRRRTRPPGARRLRARRRGRAALGLGAALAVVTLTLLAGPLAGRAGAHATLIGTTPADDEMLDRAPGEVELRFDEPVELVEGGDGTVQVIDPDGERTDRGQVDTADGGATLTVPVDGAGRGTYTVAWRVVSEDGHNLSGSFVFHVGERTGAATLDGGGDTLADVAGGVGRWAAFAGAMVVVGAGLLAALAARSAGPAPTGPAGRPSVGAAGAAGTSTAAADGRTASDTTGTTADEDDDSRAAGAAAGLGHDRPWGGSAVRHRLRPIMLVAALLGAAGMAAALVAQAADASGRSLLDAVGITPDLVLDTRHGVLGVVRLVALLLAAALLAVPRTARLPLLAPVAAAGSLVCASLAGHAWTAPTRALAVPSDVLHVLAAAAWLGGVVALVAVLGPGGSAGAAGPAGPAGPAGQALDRIRLVRRFSSLSLVAIGLVAVTGTVSGIVQVRSLDGLTSTGYGQLLLAKVAGFGLIVLLGFYNRQIVLPHLERMLHQLARSVRAEVAVAAAVLAVTAALVNQPPARDRDEQAAGPVSVTETAEGGATLQATVDPGTVGPNDLHLYFSDGGGGELVVAAVEVSASVGDLPPRRLEVTPVTPSHVSVLDAALSPAGTWTFEVTALTAGQPTTFRFEVRLP